MLSTPRDIWYWDDETIDFDTSGCEVLSRRAYLDHPTYSSINYVNAYWHWRMPQTVTRVNVSEPGWIDTLPASEQSRVVRKQIELGRGLVFPISHFDDIPPALRAYVVGEQIVISRAAWLLLNQEIRFTALERERLAWDDIDCYPLPKGAPDHIQKIANTYIGDHGANCLATTSYCITGDESLRQLWMVQPTFIDILESFGYVPAKSENAAAGDVVTFTSDGTIVHAAYCICTDRFVNKNGQSMFNPVRVVSRAMLDADWGDTDASTYRNNGFRK